MSVFRRARLGIALGFAAIAVVAAMDVGARPKPPVIDAPPPMPDVGMAESFIHDAAAYDTYMRAAALISPAFANGDSVAQSLRQGVAYEPGEFQRGEVAFAAIAALQNKTFVEAVRTEGATPDGRYAIVSRLFANPAAVLDMTGGPLAAGMAKGALEAEGMKLLVVGKAVRQAAYDIQHQPWSKADVVGRDERLAAVKELSATPRSVSSDDTGFLRGEIAGLSLPDTDVDPAPPPYSPLVIHATVLAALAAIGQAGDEQAANLSWLQQDYFTQHCLNHAKNELKECLAVAKPNYEDVFCLGQQAMIYTAQCVVQGAGGVVPLELVTLPLHIPRAHIGRKGAHHAKRPA